jgi:hypothetical protein
MKKLLAFVLFTAPLVASAQNSDVLELSLLRGGEIAVDFRAGINFNGFGPGTSQMGGITSSRVNSGPGSLITNPAELGLLRRGVLVVDGHPAAGIWKNSPYQQTVIDEIHNTLETETNNTINDTTVFRKTDDSYIKYTRMNAVNAGFATRLGAFALAVPVTDRLTAAVSVSQPLDIRMDLTASGISTKMAMEQGTQDVSLRFDIMMNAAASGSAAISMQQVNAGFGYLAWRNKRGDQLSLGATASRYEFVSSQTLNADLSGMVVIGGADERFFNNPNDVNLDPSKGESNEMFLRVTNNARDLAWGYRAGLLYRRKWLTASFAYNHMPAFNLIDQNATTQASVPVFLYPKPDGDGEQEVVDLQELQPAKPNLTSIRGQGSLEQNIDWQMPSSVNAGFDVAMGAHTLSLNYAYYLGDFRMRVFGDEAVGRRNPMGVGFGLDFRGTDRFATWHQLYIFPLRLLFLDVDGILFQAFRKRTGYHDPHYRFGFRAMTGTGFEESTNGNDLGNLFTTIPITPLGFSMGREYTLGQNLRVGVTTFAFPDLMFRLALAYQF